MASTTRVVSFIYIQIEFSFFSFLIFRCCLIYSRLSVIDWTLKGCFRFQCLCLFTLAKENILCDQLIDCLSFPFLFRFLLLLAFLWPFCHILDHLMTFRLKSFLFGSGCFSVYQFHFVMLNKLKTGLYWLNE